MAETVSPSAITTMLVPISPDGGWGWVVVAGTFFVHVFADGFVYSLGVLVDALITVSFLPTFIFNWLAVQFAIGESTLLDG